MWITIEAERALYVDRGRDVILCDRGHSGPVTLVIKVGGLKQMTFALGERKRGTDIVERLKAMAAMDLRAGPILAHTLDTAGEAANEIERLLAFLWTISRMKVMPDDTCNRINLAAAIEMAERALVR